MQHKGIQIDLRDGDVEAVHIDGVKQENFSVALQDDKTSSFRDVEFDSPIDYEKEEDLGYLKLAVQPGDMSLLWVVCSKYAEVCTETKEEADRVMDLHKRFTMGGE
tara:strand:- start:994 stop:1311 length:318 start_codon:yes stop_codon:yes gene_type:complete